MTLSLGDQTYKIPLTLFQENRSRVCEALRHTKKIQNESTTFVMLQGGTEDQFGFYDTDTNMTTFRQVSK